MSPALGSALSLESAGDPLPLPLPPFMHVRSLARVHALSKQKTQTNKIYRVGENKVQFHSFSISKYIYDASSSFRNLETCHMFDLF